ncbi:fluoride efflux transporter FluC [Glycomyces algeriensis]|uniref:Fluoride-specific ion channel FluC n=1 Tax=Glycomyces algeriensis TaxID=256037 RepID=A0A9W6G668_9ACTN|nr:CrcB family protein [Glycomyces algeriensis]MDA1367175.1 CrcB family protein [Glycomyces algeriensis]MDR7353442.1 CrcB protein [Glycomyces algeriensis]GLI41140.1 putative fluoride ion transporter CrcB [Glycomyces algeriensis]
MDRESQGRPPLRQALRSVSVPALAAVAAGGAIGALARYGLTVAFPAAPGAFPVATFTANTVGGLLIGALMITVTEVAPGLGRIRPFVGVGILGGFTTFSTYILDIGRTASAGATALAVVYAFTTIAAALLAAAVAMYATRRLLVRRRA